MDWIKQNKFLAGLVAAVVVGAAVLLVLIFSASGRYTEVAEEYERQAVELRRLENLKPYPNAENLKKLEQQKEEYAQLLKDMRKRLSALEFKAEPMTPEQFQDKLRASVSEVTAKAAENRVELPPDFYLGFDRYRTEPPAGDAATPLGKQLQAIEFIVNELIESKVDKIEPINRTPLPQEPGGAAPEAARPPGEPRQQEELLLYRYPVAISFTAEQMRFRRVLNSLSTSDKQFYIISWLNVKNQQEKGPPRATPAPGAATPPPTPAQPVEGGEVAAETAEEKAAPMAYIVGAEKLDVTMGIDIIDFTEPAAQETAAK